MMAERVALYHHIPLRGRTIPVKDTPSPVDDYIPEEAEVVEAVKCLQLKCLGGPSVMRV